MPQSTFQGAVEAWYSSNLRAYLQSVEGIALEEFIAHFGELATSLAEFSNLHHACLFKVLESENLMGDAAAFTRAGEFQTKVLQSILPKTSNREAVANSEESPESNQPREAPSFHSKKAEEDEWELSKQVFDLNPFPIAVYDLETLRFLSVNPAAIKASGYSREEFLGLSVVDLFPVESREALAKHLETLGRRPYSGEWKHCLKNGTVVDVLLISHPLEISGRRTRMVITQDISAKKRTETELLESQKRLRILETAIEYANDVVLITEAEPIDEPGPRIIYANRAFTKMTGYRMEELIGRTPRILQGPGTSTESRTRIRKALETWSSITLEILNYRKDGNEFWSELSIEPVPDPTGYFTHWVAIQRDVTERHLTEVRLRQLARMEAIGGLTAGVAHNFNNILLIILGYAELIERDTEVPELIRKKSRSIRGAALRGAEIVKQLMVFSRTESTNSTLQDLNQVTTETLSFVERLLPNDIHIESTQPPDPLPVVIDPGQFSQALVNLVTNARDAMPNGGILQVKTGRQTVTETDFLETRTRTAFFEGHPLEGEFVFVSVSDSGFGMDRATKHRIFEPFFTTKDLYEGTGLGLATLYGFINHHLGFIQVDSDLGKGTTFRLFFPSSKNTVQKENPPNEDDFQHLFSGLTALVVDDEKEVVEIQKDLLSSFGFTVLTAGDGQSALGLALSSETTIDLLITDEVMSGMRGAPLIEYFLKIRPQCALLLISGSREGESIIDRLPENVGFLQKPFSRHSFLEALRKLLPQSEFGQTQEKS